MVKVAPSLLVADFSRLAREVRSVKEEGADMLHWDIMDGHFVPNLSFGPIAVRWMRDKTELPFSVHLMLENPEDFIEKFADSGMDVLFVHVEVLDGLRRVLRKIRSLGMDAGIILRPEMG